MKILFLTDNFPPEVNAPATRTYEHCREWVKQGAEVTVITCAPNFPQGRVYKGYKNRLYQTEMMDGIRVVRVWSYIVANKGVLKRTLDFISYAVSAFIAGLFQKTDLIVATSPQFFTALSGRTLAFWKRVPWVMEVRDLWPASIKTVGAVKSGPFIRHLEWQEARCYKSARKIVVVTESFRKEIAGRGFDERKIHVVTNGVDKTLFSPQAKNAALVKELGLEGKTVIAYIGTHGMAHKLDFILHCARNLAHEKPEYHFLLMGEGAEKENLKRLHAEWGVTNVTMLDAVPKHEVKRYLSVVDICLINLKRSPLFLTVIPSKIFENAAMGIPILMGVGGEARGIVEKYGAGRCFEPEDEADFRAQLNALSDKNTYDQCRAGCLKLADAYDRKRLAGEMFNLLKEITNTPTK